MSELDLKVDVDSREVKRALDRLKKAGKDLRPPLRALKRPLVDSLFAIAQSETGPDGPWPSLSESSARRRRASKFPWMLGAITQQRGNTKVSQRSQDLIAKNKIGFSGLHQEGYTTPTGGVVPARTFLFFDDEFLELANARIGAYLEQEWAK